jgi:RHS repeat-associated protein
LDSFPGLLYYQSRYYNPSLNRFISADTVVGDPGNPQQLNRYSYVTNNPLRYTDPSGHQGPIGNATSFSAIDWSQLARMSQQLSVVAPQAALAVGALAAATIAAQGTEAVVLWAMEDVGPDYP